MQFQNLKISLILILFLTFPRLVFGAPSISGVEGTLSHGQNITISGADFGSKSQATPVVWDDLEDGVMNTFATIGTWNSINELQISSSGTRNLFSDYQAFLNFGGSGTKLNNAFFTGNNGILGDKWFASYWFKLDNNFDWGTSTYGNGDENLANVKIFRLWNPGSVDENFVMATQGWGDAIMYSTEYVDNPGGDFSAWNTFKDDMTKNFWHNLQFEYQESSLNLNDGKIKVWFDGEIKINDNDIKTREDYGQLKRPFILGFYDSWNDGNTDDDYFYMDDVYADNNFSRVEICLGSSWASKGKCEIQIINSWSTDSVNFSLNQGSIVDNSTTYLYLVDFNGDVNGSGFPIVINSSDAISPSAPTGLNVL